jgi:hypothetical protein
VVAAADVGYSRCLGGCKRAKEEAAAGGASSSLFSLFVAGGHHRSLLVVPPLLFNTIDREAAHTAPPLALVHGFDRTNHRIDRPTSGSWMHDGWPGLSRAPTNNC